MRVDFKPVSEQGELIDLDGDARAYQLVDLKPSTGYEVRLSFPASIPAFIKFQIVDSSAAAPPLRSKPARRLLDCEKLIFATDSNGAVQGFANPAVLVTAKRRSVHRDGPTAGASKLVYNIVLAELLPVVGLPLDSIPVVVAVVAAVLIALVWSLYWSRSIFPRLLLWLTAAPAAAADSSSASKRDN
uniref:Uncharacterized protein n=1 Tax=Tetradesmus obliquus TaxID=3088 RepID=A0A383VZ02_TETOB|eukprot:jgi/Sobl393_1/12712/SZX70688.1